MMGADAPGETPVITQSLSTTISSCRAVALLALLVVLATCRADAPTAGAVLAEGWDTATDVAIMHIPAACPTQRIEYRGWQKDAASPASVEFVVSQMDREIHSTASGDFADYTSGVVDWTLKDAQVYALTVRGVNARWRFAVTCQ